MTIEPDMREADTAAAELALGVLDGAERAAALRRVLAEPDFARDVERWRDHFATLFDGVAEVAPGGHLLERIEDRIAPSRPSANPWKPTAIAASLAALAMTAVALRPVVVASPPPVVADAPAPAITAAPMIAAMALADSGGAQPAMYDAEAGMVKMPGPMPIPAGKSAQLWVIEGDGPPKPLGTFHSTAPGTYEAEARMGAVIPAGATLTITLEPEGGSPTGAPTGPVIARGTLSKV